MLVGKAKEAHVDIGSRVRAVRRAEGLSQEALARRADVSLNVVSRLERGEITDPHITTLSNIAAGLGISVGELLEEPALAGKAQAPPEPGGTERRSAAEGPSAETEAVLERVREALAADLIAVLEREQLAEIRPALPEGFLREAVSHALARPRPPDDAGGG